MYFNHDIFAFAILLLIRLQHTFFFLSTSWRYSNWNVHTLTKVSTLRRKIIERWQFHVQLWASAQEMKRRKTHRSWISCVWRSKMWLFQFRLSDHKVFFFAICSFLCNLLTETTAYLFITHSFYFSLWIGHIDFIALDVDRVQYPCA